MDLADETFLSAYLDGELDPAQRLAVEAALLSSPRLGERLRELAVVRELVASLPRPVVSLDLAPSVLRRIGRRPPARSLRNALHPYQIGVPRSVAGWAALVLIALTIALLARAGRNGPSAAGPPRAQALAPRPPAGVDRLATAATAGQVPQVGTRPKMAQAPPALIPTPTSAPLARRVDVAEEDLARQQRWVRQMLDSPRLRRIFVVTDVLGGGTRDRVNSLVQQTPRSHSDYGRITVSQGIVIDPEHPGEATVFALVMDDSELLDFQKKLQESFPGSVAASDPNPTVVTQLADIGQVAVLPGTAAAGVEIPAEGQPQVALRANPPGETGPDPAGPQDDAVRTTQDDGPERRTAAPADSPTPVGADAPDPPVRDPIAERARDNFVSRQAGSSSPPPEGTALAPLGKVGSDRPHPGKPSVVLVWVTLAGR